MERLAWRRRAMTLTFTHPLPLRRARQCYHHCRQRRLRRTHKTPQIARATAAASRHSGAPAAASCTAPGSSTSTVARATVRAAGLVAVFCFRRQNLVSGHAECLLWKDSPGLSSRSWGVQRACLTLPNLSLSSSCLTLLIQSTIIQYKENDNNSPLSSLRSPSQTASSPSTVMVPAYPSTQVRASPSASPAAPAACSAAPSAYRTAPQTKTAASSLN